MCISAQHSPIKAELRRTDIEADPNKKKPLLFSMLLPEEFIGLAGIKERLGILCESFRF
jgi:hypothetical protein